MRARIDKTLLFVTLLHATGPAFAQGSGDSRPPEVRECDRLASHPHDPDRREPGVSDDQMVPHNAIAACEVALPAATAGDQPRIWFELGRGYWLAHRDTDAFGAFWEAQKLGYAPAKKYIGDAYLQGRGLSGDETRNPAKAAQWYKEAGAGGFDDGTDQADKIADEVAKSTFDGAGFQNADLIGALYYNDYRAISKPQLLVYTVGLVHTISDEQTMYIDSSCRALSTYAADIITRYGKDAGSLGIMYNTLAEGYHEDDPVLLTILRGLIGSQQAPYIQQSITNEGQRDAMVLVNKYGCKSPVAQTIMGNVVAFSDIIVNKVGGGLDAIRGVGQ